MPSHTDPSRLFVVGRVPMTRSERALVLIQMKTRPSPTIRIAGIHGNLLAVPSLYSNHHTITLPNSDQNTAKKKGVTRTFKPELRQRRVLRRPLVIPRIPKLHVTTKPTPPHFIHWLTRRHKHRIHKPMLPGQPTDQSHLTIPLSHTAIDNDRHPTCPPLPSRSRSMTRSRR